MTKSLNAQETYDAYRREITARFKSGRLVGKSVAEVNREVAEAIGVKLGKNKGTKKGGDFVPCPEDQLEVSKGRQWVDEVLIEKITKVINEVLTEDQILAGLEDGRIQLVQDLSANYRDKHADDLEGKQYFPGIVVNARDGLDRVDEETLAEELADF